MKVYELTGARLDYWVAQADETWKRAHQMFPAWTLDPTFKAVELQTHADGTQECVLIPNNPFRQDQKVFAPSTDWAHGGPIIQRARIACGPSASSADPEDAHYAMTIAGNGQVDGNPVFGPTTLIAAMRAFVASKFGDKVPEETQP